MKSHVKKLYKKVKKDNDKIIITNKKKVYISSKMTGIENFNFPAFYKKAKELETMGFEVLNPATMEMHTERINL